MYQLELLWITTWSWCSFPESNDIAPSTGRGEILAFASGISSVQTSSRHGPAMIPRSDTAPQELSIVWHQREQRLPS